MGLDNTPIHQISAGTSHSAAWTAIPADRKVSTYAIYDVCTMYIRHVHTSKDRALNSSAHRP